MALNFPSSPTIGQVYSDSTSGFSYEWDGTVWRSYSPSSSSQIKVLDNISGFFNGVTVSFPITSGGGGGDLTFNRTLTVDSTVVGTAFPATFLELENGKYDDFTVVWNAINDVVEVPTELVAEFTTLAESCNLPQEFIAIFSAT